MPIELQGGGNLQTQDGDDLLLQGESGGVNITLHPADSLVFDQATVTFTGAATSANAVEFDWYFDGEVVAEASTSSYSFKASLDDAEKLVYFIARDTVTLAEAQSNNATLSVISRPEVIKSGQLYTASYPEFFPCPTWEYAQGISSHLTPRQFDSGWIRQRRRWRENYSTVQLSFTMNTDMYSRWNRWMVNNGYKWFSLYLDRITSGQILAEVRLISKMRFGYTSHDTVKVTVLGELGAMAAGEGLDGEVLEPKYGPTGDPVVYVPPAPEYSECQPYSCSAFVDEAMSLGFEVADFTEFQGAATLPEYLSLSDGSSSQIRVGPNYLSNVGSGMPVAPCSSYWTIEAGDIDQCESFIRGVVVPDQVNSPGSTNITKFTSPYKSLVFLHKGGLSSGWSAVSSLLGFKMYFDYAEVGDSSGSSSVAFDLKWSPPSLGGVGFSWHAGGSGGFFGAPTWAGGVNYTAVSIDVGAVYLEPEYQGPQNNPWNIDAYVDVVFSAVTSVGVFTHTIKYKFFGVASTGPDNLTISNVYFGDSSLFAGAGANLFCLGGSAEVDLDKLQALIYAHQRNFADYEPPAWCPGPKPEE